MPRIVLSKRNNVIQFLKRYLENYQVFENYTIYIHFQITDKSKTKVAMDIRKYFELDDNEDMA